MTIAPEVVAVLVAALALLLILVVSQGAREVA
jgi:hypothetical protein